MSHPEETGGHFSALRPAQEGDVPEVPRLVVSERSERMRPNRGQFLCFLTSGSTWAILCCLVAVSSSFMPWHFVAPAEQPWLRTSVRGISSQYGTTVICVFGAGALLFLATYSARGWRLWKPLAHALLGLVCLYYLLSYPSEMRQSGTQFSEVAWGLYVAGGAAVALLVVAALEVNAYFFRKQYEASPS
jgi:hypothetical protein